MTNQSDIILGVGEQYADALQVPRHVWVMWTENLLENRPGFPGNRQDSEGPFQKCRIGDAEQSGQRDTVEQNSRFTPEAKAKAKAKAEAEEESGWRAQEKTSGSS